MGIKTNNKWFKGVTDIITKVTLMSLTQYIRTIENRNAWRTIHDQMLMTIYEVTMTIVLHGKPTRKIPLKVLSICSESNC